MAEAVKPMKVAHYICERLDGKQWVMRYDGYSSRTEQRHKARIYTAEERNSVNLTPDFCWVAIIEQRL